MGLDHQGKGHFWVVWPTEKQWESLLWCHSGQRTGLLNLQGTRGGGCPEPTRGKSHEYFLHEARAMRCFVKILWPVYVPMLCKFTYLLERCETGVCLPWTMWRLTTTIISLNSVAVIKAAFRDAAMRYTADVIWRRCGCSCGYCRCCPL